MRFKTMLGSLALGLVLATGCGSDGDDETGVATAGGERAETTAPDPEDAAADFAACMREHGVDVPDPGPDGMILIEPGAEPPDPDVQAEADAACAEEREALQGGAGGNPAEFQDAVVAMAGCMRDKGFDVPDPSVGSGGQAEMPLDPGQLEDPSFQEAQRECRDEVGLPEPGTTPGGP